MSRHRPRPAAETDDGLIWIPDYPAMPARTVRPRRDWLADLMQAGVILAALIQIGFIALIWSGHPKPVEGAVWTVVFGSWDLIAAAMWLVLQRVRRD